MWDKDNTNKFRKAYFIFLLCCRQPFAEPSNESLISQWRNFGSNSCWIVFIQPHWIFFSSFTTNIVLVQFVQTLTRPVASLLLKDGLAVLLDLEFMILMIKHSPLGVSGIKSRIHDSVNYILVRRFTQEVAIFSHFHISLIHSSFQTCSL